MTTTTSNLRNLTRDTFFPSKTVQLGDIPFMTGTGTTDTTEVGGMFDAIWTNRGTEFQSGVGYSSSANFFKSSDLRISRLASATPPPRLGRGLRVLLSLRLIQSLRATQLTDPVEVPQLDWTRWQMLRSKSQTTQLSLAEQIELNDFDSEAQAHDDQYSELQDKALKPAIQKHESFIASLNTIAAALEKLLEAKPK